VVERDKLGGRCLNYACIPAKAVLRSADLLAEIREASEYGLNVASVEVDFAAVQARREKVVTTLTSGVGGLFKKNKIDVIEGDAALNAEGQVVVGEETYAAATVILATGSTPRSIPGIDFGTRIIGTEQAWALAELPARLAVIGAGASGAEIASGYARLGSEVHLIEALDRLLPSEDPDVSRLVERGFKRQDIDVRTGEPIADVSEGDSGVTFKHGEESGLEVDYLVVCAGRAADVSGLGLEDAGIELDDRGLIKVDGALRTSRAGVYAIGDLVAGPALAHKASDEGIIAVEDSAGMQTHPIAYVDIPRATFCTPNVGSFGLTEEQAREQGYDVVVGKVPYGAELLGGHIVGARATELIQELVNVRALEGGYAEVGRIIHGHPTLSEAVMEAGRAADGWLIHG
jgi:dihydrolipoamide dehydrogenase